MRIFTEGGIVEEGGSDGGPRRWRRPRIEERRKVLHTGKD